MFIFVEIVHTMFNISNKDILKSIIHHLVQSKFVSCSNTRKRERERERETEREREREMGRKQEVRAICNRSSNKESELRINQAYRTNLEL